MDNSKIIKICEEIKSKRVSIEDKEKCPDETRAIMCGFNMGLDAALSTILQYIDKEDSNLSSRLLNDLRD